MTSEQLRIEAHKLGLLAEIAQQLDGVRCALLRIEPPDHIRLCDYEPVLRLCEDLISESQRVKNDDENAARVKARGA